MIVGQCQDLRRSARAARSSRRGERHVRLAWKRDQQPVAC